jgi:hypothetical protein
MNKSTVAAMAVALSTAASACSASAMSIPAPLQIAAASAGVVQKAAVFCGPYGCGPIWPGPRHWQPEWGPWGHTYRPACPIDYYYACRRGPLGDGQCACWPYRRW